MKTTECICAYCDKKFLKPTNEYNRRMRKNSKVYCSRACAVRINRLSNFGDKRNTTPPPKSCFRKEDKFLYYLRNVKRRNHEVDVTSDYLSGLWNTQGGKCAYTKLPLILNSSSKRNLDFRYTASLDRIDSNLGYVIGNVQFVSTAINYMKNTMSHSQCIEFLQQISATNSLIS
jgi:hypothetical protein